MSSPKLPPMMITPGVAVHVHGCLAGVAMLPPDDPDAVQGAVIDTLLHIAAGRGWAYQAESLTLASPSGPYTVIAVSRIGSPRPLCHIDPVQTQHALSGVQGSLQALLMELGRMRVTLLCP